MRAEFKMRQTGGEIIAPPSKSMMQRAVAAALLANGRSEILDPSFCDDSLAAMGIATSLGASVERHEKRIIITGGLQPVSSSLDCKESGLSLRMFTAIAAMTGETMKIVGSGSLKSRPAGLMENPLRELGASVRTNGGFLPVEVKGPLLGGKITIDGSVSSQFLSGLLFALPLADDDSLLMVQNLTSRPYIDMTLDVLHRFGIEIENTGYNEFRIKGNQRYTACEFRVEGDWSGASFFLVMAAVSGSITIRNLDIGSKQADRKIVDVIRLAGGTVSAGDNYVTVQGGVLRPFEFDISDCPDLAPPLAVLAASCKGVSVLQGTRRLNVKESSRGDNLASALSELGAKADNQDDRIIIEGTGLLRHKVTGSFGDHRMAMAMASASVISGEGISVDETECMNKSYPGFIDDFRAAGGSVSFF